MKKESIAKKYVHYKESDFLTDSYFQEWVYQPSPDHDAFWQQVINTVPQQKETIENARLYLKSITFVTHTPTDEEVEMSWNRHLQLIQALPQPTGRVHSLRRRWLQAAAVLAGAILITGAVFFLKSRSNPQIIASTGFGEMKRVILPDGSQVDLNANSRITYSKNWEKGHNREVWLEGEALFNVTHLNKNTNQVQADESFQVHTKDLTVTVLGTIFDIRQRRLKTEVVLQSGKIKLSFANGKEQDIIMNPGQIVSYDGQEKKSSTGNISPEKFSAWKNQKLILQDPKVNEILVYLEDNFGKKIIIDDPELGNRTVNGPILISSLDDALFVLSTVLNTEVVKQDSTTIIMRPRDAR
ncbi:ferric-dicitrate binding protein FerR (iron transport regulator) [Chitinophaga terrae (ex Kim and Jung 2007)]|uniref:FecR family protein n=1 Tax=Chitinophaga terrae (ex Kim and Jung 2007) TaxID=408074 RepID=UPI002782EC16|nr:FecR domain-containing protein [Chitinophaga terrae (ex Kim and Jung 2007)]MDQ0109010.1 ferric-dicitrate binding protein FerR (iron transport regulator) [Chitinophaga terrae (ex Kim and Jung 2007)]